MTPSGADPPLAVPGPVDTTAPGASEPDPPPRSEAQTQPDAPAEVAPDGPGPAPYALAVPVLPVGPAPVLPVGPAPVPAPGPALDPATGAVPDPPPELVPDALVVHGSPPGPVPDGTAASVDTTARRRGRGAHSKRRRRAWWVPVVVVVAVALVAAGVVGARRVDGSLTDAAVTPAAPSTLVVSGTKPNLPWPATGQGAVSLPSLGFTAQSGPETPVPVASLTKLATALVILRDHPVAPGSSGPSITVSPGDVAEYDFELGNDESNIPIQAGEMLTERQMLEALLIRSANDIAYSLALWDAGSLPAFVAKMNAAAAGVGATSTHYVDVSGYQPGSVSTAADCLRIAAADMAIPTFADVVDMSSVTLPLAGTVPNIVTEIGSGGVIGIKSGFTSQAMACMVLASNRVIDGRTVLVLAAVLAQPVSGATPAPTKTSAPTPASSTTTTPPTDVGGVPNAFRLAGPAAQALLSAAAAAVVQFTVVTPGTTAAVVTSTWGGTRARTGAVTVQGAWLAGWPNQPLKTVTRMDPVPPGARAGRIVGEIDYSLGTQVESVPLKLAGPVAEPSWWWRLVHN